MTLTARPLSELPQISAGLTSVRKGSYFFRKNCEYQYPALVRHMKRWREERPGQPYYCILDQEQAAQLRPRLTGLLHDDVPQANLFYEHGYNTGII